MVLELTSKNFKEAVNKSDPIIVDFFATWCGPCMSFAPTFEKVSHEYAGKLRFAKINIEDDGNQEIASNAGVLNIPCMIIFKKGEEVDRVVGALQEHAFKQKINQVLS